MASILVETERRLSVCGGPPLGSVRPITSVYCSHTMQEQWNSNIKMQWLNLSLISLTSTPPKIAIVEGVALHPALFTHRPGLVAGRAATKIKRVVVLVAKVRPCSALLVLCITASNSAPEFG